MSEKRMDESLPQEVFQETLRRMSDRLALTEQFGDSGTAYLPLESHAPFATGRVGAVRLFVGEPLFRVVTCSLRVDTMTLDSHMLFAFTPATSAVPHFTLDAVQVGEHYAYHLDLIPRLDLGANLLYMDEVYAPLSSSFESCRAIPGLSPAHLSQRQLAIMSPWMLAHRATESAFKSVGPVVEKYQDHWFSLLDSGVSAEALAGTTPVQLAARNLSNKRMIFDPDVDPVWNRIEPIIGTRAVAAQRALLIGEDE